MPNHCTQWLDFFVDFKTNYSILKCTHYLQGSFGNYVSSKDHSSKFPKILRRRQYERRLSWENVLQKRRAKLDGSESEDEFEIPDISELRVPPDEDIFHVSQTLPEVAKQNGYSLTEEIIVDHEVVKGGDRGWFPQMSEWGNTNKSNDSLQGQPPSPGTKLPQVIDVDDEITILSDAEESTQKADDKENQHPNVASEKSSNGDDDIEIISKDVQMSETTTSKRDDDEDLRLQVSDSEGSVEMMSVDEKQFQNDESQQEDETEAVIVINDTDCTGSKESLLKHW